MNYLLRDVEVALRRLVTLTQSDDFRSIVCGPSSAPMDLDDRLASFIYSRWYCAPDEVQTIEPMLGRSDMTMALRAAVASANRFQSGWVVLQSAQDGVCVAARRGLNRELKPGEYANLSRPGLPVAPGDAVAVCECLQWIDAATGFWYLQSAMGGPDKEMIRLYWSARHNSISFILRELTEVLDSLNLRYALKCPFLASSYTRVDALIVYLERRVWPSLRPVIDQIAAKLTPCLRNHCPPLTLALAPGVAFAENPHGKESFGESRCRALAPAVRALIEQHVASDEVALSRLLEGLIVAAIDPQQPWLNGRCDG